MTKLNKLKADAFEFLSRSRQIANYFQGILQTNLCLIIEKVEHFKKQIEAEKANYLQKLKSITDRTDIIISLIKFINIEQKTPQFVRVLKDFSRTSFHFCALEMKKETTNKLKQLEKEIQELQEEVLMINVAYPKIVVIEAKTVPSTQMDLKSFTLSLAPYSIQAAEWPCNGTHIIGQHDQYSIIVYQAFNKAIAMAAVKAKNFHDDSVKQAGYSMKRMSWIKTNFLWMMFRSGWATKRDQEHILAIRITKIGFEEILKLAATKGDSLVRLQWDPDHLPNGKATPNGRRDIQLGLRGEILERFSNEFILEIMDITDFVREQSLNINQLDKLMMPLETIYDTSLLKTLIN